MNYLSVVNYCFFDHPGGAPRVAWDMCKIMQARGHKVTMFCPKDKPSNDDISKYEGIRVVRFESPKTFFLDPFKVQKKIAAGMNVANMYLLKTRWDVVHIHVPIEGKIITSAIGPGPRYIYTAHSPAVLEQKFNWSQHGFAGKVKELLGTGPLKRIEGDLLRNADRIQTLSQFTKSAIDGFYSVGSKVSILPHWCRKDFVRQHSKEQARTLLGWPQDELILLSVRGMRERYGVDVAIKAAAPLLKKYRRLRFMHVGDGFLRESLLTLAKDLGVDDKIWFMGRVSDDVLRQCYEAADVFILPTRALECFGLIVLEAYAYGLPIISTDASALPELIRPIAPDMLVPAGQVEPLQKKIETFVEGTLRVPSPEALIEYVQKNYSYEVIVPQIVELLEGT